MLGRAKGVKEPDMPRADIHPDDTLRQQEREEDRAYWRELAADAGWWSEYDADAGGSLPFDAAELNGFERAHRMVEDAVNVLRNTQAEGSAP